MSNDLEDSGVRARWLKELDQTATLVKCDSQTYGLFWLRGKTGPKWRADARLALMPTTCVLLRCEVPAM